MDVDVDMDEAEGSSGGDHATSGNMAEGVAAVTDFAKAAAETVADKEVAIERKFAGAEKKSRAKTKAFNTVETLWSSKKEAFARIGHECADVERSLVEAFHKLSLESLLPGGHEGIDLDDENLATMFTDDVMKEAASEMKERLSSVQASSNLYQSFQELCDTALKLVSKKHKCMLCERGFGCYDDDIDEAGYIAQVQKLKKQSLEKSANKDVHNETAQAEQQLAEFNSAKDNLFLPLRLKMKQLKKMKKDLDVLAQKRDAAEGEHSAAAEMLASLKEQYDAIKKLDQQGRLLLRQIKSVQAAHKKVTELQEMLPTSANPIAMVGSDDDDNGNNDDDAGALGPSSLPDLSTNLKKISNDLAKANSIEDMESLEHRVGRLRSEVQNCVERIEH